MQTKGHEMTLGDPQQTHRKTRNNGESKKQEEKATSSKSNKKVIPDAEAILEDPYKVISEPQYCCSLEGKKINARIFYTDVFDLFPSYRT